MNKKLCGQWVGQCKVQVFESFVVRYLHIPDMFVILAIV